MKKKTTPLEDLYTSPLRKDATASVKAKLKKEKAGQADLMSKGKHVTQLLDKFRKTPKGDYSEGTEKADNTSGSIEERMNALNDRIRKLNKEIQDRLQG